jgi:hypothetical protein
LLPKPFTCIKLYGKNLGILIEVILPTLAMSWLHPLLHHIAVQTSGANLHRKILLEIILHGVSGDIHEIISS